jgi:hypothetical protein
MDDDHFRSFRSDVINVFENLKLARDRTESRQPLFLITRPAKVSTQDQVRGKLLAEFAVARFLPALPFHT